MLFRNYFNPLCVCFAKKVYDHDAKYPFRDAVLSLNVCPPWCVLADYYFRLRTNRCVSVQVAVGHGRWFLKQCSSMHVFKGPNIVHSSSKMSICSGAHGEMDHENFPLPDNNNSCSQLLESFGCIRF